jgi:hypothetical protein
MGGTMDMRNKRIALTFTEDDLAWGRSVQDEIRAMGHEPPGLATLFRDLIRALRRDDEAAHSVGITVASCH